MITIFLKEMIMNGLILGRLVAPLSILLSLTQTSCQMPGNHASGMNVSTNEGTIVNALPTSTPDGMTKDDKEQPPVLIRKVTKTPGKPPLQIYSFDIEFRSRRDNYTWLLVRSDADKPLSESGEFRSDPMFDTAISGFEYPGQSNGQVVVVQFFGKAGFRAIRPPEKGSINFGVFTQLSRLDVSQFEVWEVRSLLVNGETPLEEWLPYDSGSVSTARPLNDQNNNGRSLRFGTNSDTNTQTTHDPKEIKFVVAQGVRKWNVPFKLATNRE